MKRGSAVRPPPARRLSEVRKSLKAHSKQNALKRKEKKKEEQGLPTRTSSTRAPPPKEDLHAYAVEQGSKMYGYGLLCSVAGCLQMLVISVLPMTDWNTPDGIPRYSPWYWIAFLHARATIVDPLFHVFGYAVYEPPLPSTPTEGWKHAFSWMLPYWVAVSNVWVFLGYTLPTLLGVEPF